MIPNRTTAVAVTGDLGGESRPMSIDWSNETIVMSALTRLYTDPVGATVREVLANALDANLAIGQTRPLEVSMPSGLSPTFSVRDFGAGMSVDHFFEYYLKYGASSKRDNNREHGSLGLGCKSPLAYTNEFHVSSVNNGVKFIATVSMDTNGAGRGDILDTFATDEPSGTLVSIPTRSADEFGAKVRSVVNFWEPGLVLIDGREVEPYKMIKLSDDLFIVEPGQDVFRSHVVSGQIAYPLDLRLAGLNETTYKFAVRVGIGDIDFIPNRESLEYTVRTKKFIVDATSNVQKKVADYVNKVVAHANTAPEALRAAFEVNNTLALPNRLSGNLCWRGMKFEPDVHQNAVRFHLYRHRNAVSTINDFQVGPRGPFFVVGAPNQSGISALNKQKLRTYFQGTDASEVLLVTENSVKSDWLHPDFIVPWSAVRDVQITPGGRVGPTGLAGKFKFYETGTEFVEPDFPDNKEIVYFSPADHQTLDFIRLSSMFKDHIFVSLSRNRWDKFCRELPEAMTVTTFTRKVLAEAESKIDAFALAAKRVNVPLHLRSLKPDEVDDPDLKELARWVQAWYTDGSWSEPVAGLNEYAEIARILQVNVPTLANVHADPNVERMISKVSRRYPLFDGYTANRQDKLDYVNALYAYRKDSK